MKQFILIWLIIPLFIPAKAQKELPSFGKTDLADLRLKSCSFEPDANAMKLFDVQEINFDPGEYSTKLITEKRVRIKIFNEKGYSHATIRIPYYGSRKTTKIKDLSGVIYNLDPAGALVVRKLEKKDFFREKEEDKVRVINFTFPDLKPGSVIEFRYTKIEKDVLQIDPWIVQDKIPVAYASTILTTPSYSRIKEKIYGTDTMPQKTISIEHGNLRLTKRIYYRENIPSFEPEPLMSSINDNLSRVIFLLIPSSNFFIDVLTNPEVLWDFTGEMLMRAPFFGGQVRKTIPGTEKLIDSARKIDAIPERVRFIYEAVQNRIPQKTEQTFYPNDISEAWKNRAGNTAEINLVLLNLLKKAGVQAYPLLVSTRTHGKINKSFPSSGQFNGVDVVAADTSNVFVMDASLKYQLYQDPPANIMNREAFLLDSSDSKWVMIEDSRPLYKVMTAVDASVKEEGKINGDAITYYYHYAKSEMLDSTSKEDEDDQDKITDKKPQGLTILSTTQQHTESDSLPFEQHIEFSYEPQSTGDFYFLNPMFLANRQSNPFMKDTRNTDIDFGCNQHFSFTFSLHIPPSYHIEKLPKNITVRAPDSVFFYQRFVASDSSRIYFKQVFDVERAIYDKEEYPGIKEFFTRMYALMAEEIILKKIR